VLNKTSETSSNREIGQIQFDKKVENARQSIKAIKQKNQFRSNIPYP
jgi:hypothetical protein